LKNQTCAKNVIIRYETLKIEETKPRPNDYIFFAITSIKYLIYLQKFA
jgi:hypothetical protein